MKPLSVPKLEISLLPLRRSVDLTIFHIVFPAGLHLIEGGDVSHLPLSPQPQAQVFYEPDVQAVIAKEGTGC